MTIRVARTMLLAVIALSIAPRKGTAEIHPPEIEPAPEAAPAELPELPYDVRYDARIVPTERAAHVSIRLGNGASHVRILRFRIDPERHLDFEGDGKIEHANDRVEWTPPSSGGKLSYVFRIDHFRDELSYDSRCAADWALFRGDDLVPPVKARTERGAMSEASLRLRLPAGWSAALPYKSTGQSTWHIDNPRRRFDRPVGWMVFGKRLGVLRERVAGCYLAVAGPVGHDLRRHDILAFLRWNLPSLSKVLTLPERILVVGAGDPMWRGGLSGPGSLFVHADRPLITPDGTSPLLHELVHTAMRNGAGPGDDWIVEGIAELYSLEMMVRSRTISRRRYEKSMTRLADRARAAKRLRVESSSGAVTARAVTVLRALDREIRARSQDQYSLDDVVRHLASQDAKLTTDRLRAAAELFVGEDLKSFFDRNVGKK